MLVVLGFLVATLIALAFAPIYRARAMRLTYKHIRRVLPLTESEIQVDRDRLRAQYAIRIHDLETKLEKARLAAARQQVEVNRRDAAVAALEAELAQLRSDLEQNVNARRVLEQTVMDRLPAVEQRLAETRRLLEQRDRELAAITAESGKTVRALDEVMQINAQQRAEIERLHGMIATRGLRSRVGARDSRFESEVALRSELEALRAKTREQESLISRLQTLVTVPSASKRPAQANGGAAGHEQDLELERLRRDLAEAESALKSVNEQAEAGGADSSVRARLQSLENLVENQASKIRELEAALAEYEKGGSDSQSMLKDSKIAMKARIASLQAQVENRTAMVEKLRAELASANERLALQSAQFRDEMRRLRTSAPPPAENVDENASARRSLAKRIGEANPALAASLRSGSLRSVTKRPSEADPVATQETAEAAGEAAHSVAHASLAQANGSELRPSEVKESAPEHQQAETDGQARTRLLDRIASISKS